MVMRSNENETKNVGNVEFISYDGKYPNLCSGTLALRIEGKVVRFGWDKPLGYFWSSGGDCGYKPESYVDYGKWIINEDELPDEYKKYVDEIDKVFNNNVPHGCCGGCL